MQTKTHARASTTAVLLLIVALPLLPLKQEA